MSQHDLTINSAEVEGHAQNTDIGTSAGTFTLDLDAVGSPTGRVILEVENGGDPNAKIAWNRDLGRWEWSDDGGTIWHAFGEVTADYGAQEITKYVAKEDPEKVLEQLGVGTDADYVDLDLSSYISAPLGVSAVILRVKFWDSTPGDLINIKFKQKGSGAFPAVAFTVWSGQDDPSVIVVPVDASNICQYFITASGVGTANVQVYLLGYLSKVTGVGTQDKTFTASGLNVGAGATMDFNLAGFLNRGLAHYLKVVESAGATSYDIHFYAKDTFLAADLLYKAENLNNSSDYEDWLDFWLADQDLSNELHCRIINRDGSNAGTFALTLNCEQFA